MKKQKIISFLLCFAMLLGMIPGTAFAEEYQQLYLWMGGSDYLTEMELTTGRSMNLVFAIDFEDGKTIIGTDCEINYPEDLGTIVANEEGFFVWTASDNAATGQVTVIKDGVTYAINATVTADNESGQEHYSQGFYTTMAEDGTLSGFIDSDPNDNWRYTIPFVTGLETTVYYYMENAVSFVIDGDGLSMERMDGYSGNLYAVTLAEGKHGTIDGDIQFETASGGTPGFPITFTDGTHQLYFYWDTGVYYTEVTHVAGGEETFLVFSIAQDDRDESITDDTYTYDCTEGLGTVVWDSERDCVVWTPGESAAEGQITAAKGGVTYSIDAVVTENSGGGQGGNDDPENDPYEIISTISESHTTTDDDKYTGPNWLPDTVDGLKNSATAEFKLGNDTYYMGISAHGDTYPWSGHGVGPVLAENEYQFWQFDIGFYVALPGDENFARVTDSETLAAIAEAFGNTLKLSVKGIEHAPFNFTVPAVFPALYEARGDEQCFACTVLELGAENYGTYALIATGTVNGEEICTRITLNWAPQSGMEYTPSGDDVIGEINDYVKTIDPTLRANLTINMPEGIHEGYITVPSTLTRLSISIFGAELDDNGNYTSFIRGGIHSDGYSVAVLRTAFLGAGSGEDSHPGKKWDDGTKNIALSGSGFIRTISCHFEGYDIAMCGQDVLKFGAGNTFENNNTAVLLDTIADKHHISDLSQNTFINNGIAIAFYRIPGNLPTAAITMEKCRFVDNDIDIWNKLNRNIFLPGCYFACTDEDGIETVRECQYRPIAQGNERKRVLYYPQADSCACDSFIYDTTFYERQPVISVNFANIFPIPSAALDGGQFTIMDGEEELAKITYNEAPAVSMFSLRSRSAAAFDATVEVVRTGNIRIDITLQAIPDGKTPTISVPCDESWRTATVTDPYGNTLTASVADGYVSFVAEQGGTYTIINTTVAEYMIVFDANGGSGTMASITVSEGTQYTLPECGFTAPAGMLFKEWSIADTTYQPYDVYTVMAGTTITAVWEELALEEPEEPEEPDRPVIPDVPVIPSIPETPATETETVHNEDGSITTTVTDKKTGTVTETTKYTDGTILEIVTTADGEQEISVSVPNGVEAEVTIPTANVTTGTVAVIVHEDGKEEIVPYSIPGEDSLTVKLSESAQLKIVDRAMTFSDVTDTDWFNDAVDFVSARGIMNGTGNDEFSHGGTTTRAMVWTMLARLSGTDTSGGASWYEKGLDWAMENGISDGTNANSTITREQLAVMLWRLIGSPKPADSSLAALGAFTDDGSISVYAQEALAWAVANGIVSGKGGGILAPTETATRAEVAQMLMNFLINIQ